MVRNGGYALFAYIVFPLLCNIQAIKMVNLGHMILCISSVSVIDNDNVSSKSPVTPSRISTVL